MYLPFLYIYTYLNNKEMKIGIIGTGGIGGYYGAKLAYAGKDVHFLLHSDYDHVKEHGLKVDSIDGNFQLEHPQIYKDTKEMPICDVVFVCLKTTNNYLLKDLLPPLLKKDSLIIMVQNGLGIEEDIQKMFPENYILGGLAFICTKKAEAGHIEHMDKGKLNIGIYTPATNKIRVLEVVDALNESGIDAELLDLETARWSKLIWNIPFNGLSVVMNAQTDELIKNPDTKLLVHEIMLEIIRVAHHLGLNLLPSLADKNIESTERMRPYSPSMKLDFDSKRELEIFYIYTKPIVAATLAGLEVPRISMLEKQLKYIQAKYINKK